MSLYVIKRKYTDTYYTVRNERNIPSIMAFPYAKPAKAMLKTIVSCEKHHQPLVVEKIDEEFLMNTCKRSMQSVLLFTPYATLELCATHDNIPRDNAVFYLENKFRYFS